MTYDIPVKTVSEANSREHWGAKAQRAREQRGIARFFTNLRGRLPAGNVIITLTRVCPTRHPRKLDSDNLAGSAKHIQDGIADALGVNDGDERITWKYEQACEGKAYLVRVDIKAA